MQQPPQPDLDPSDSPTPSRPRSRRSRRIQQAGLVLALLLMGGMVGGFFWLRWFVYQQLSPLIAQNLSQSLRRPVQLGPLSGVNWNSLEFGASTLPPTANDPDRLSLQSLQVGFDPLRLLTTRTLHLNLNLINPVVYVEQDAQGRWISTAIAPQENRGPIRTEIEKVSVQGGELTLVPHGPDRSGTQPVTFRQIGGDAQFFDRNQRIQLTLQGRAANQGSVNLTGEVLPPTQEAKLQVRGQNLTVPAIARLLHLPIAVQAGQASGQVGVQLKDGKLTNLNGFVDLQGGAAHINPLPQRFTQAQGRLRLQDKTLTFESLKTRYGKVALVVNGGLHFQKGLNLRAQVPATPVKSVFQTLKIQSPFPVQGVVKGSLRVQGSFQKPILFGTAQSIQTAQVDRVTLQGFRTNFRLQDGAIAFSQIQAQPTVGGQVTGAGRISLKQPLQIGFSLRGRQLPGDILARLYNARPNFRIGTVSADTEITGHPSALRTAVNWSAPEATYPGQGTVVIAGGVTQILDTRLAVAGGTVTAAGAVVGKQWQVVANADQVALKRFSRELRGNLSGQLTLGGTVNSFKPADIRAAGRLRFSQGLSLITDPIVAAVRWNGQEIQVQQATAPGFSASGIVSARLEGSQSPQITGLNLAVRAEDYNLRSLPFRLPNTLQLAGRGNFQGQLTGTPNAPQVTGNLAVNGLAVNGIGFEPVLAGNLQFDRQQGVALQVQGERDRIALNLNSEFRPESFLVRRDQAVAEGRSVGGDRLAIEVKDFPIAILNVKPAPGLGFGTVTGQLSGTGDYNWRQNTLAAQVAIAQPSIGTLKGNTFQGQIRYANNQISLTDGEFRQNRGLYALNGTVRLGRDPQFQGQLRVQEGDLQSLLATFQWFEISDLLRGVRPATYDTAAQVRPVAVGEQETTLLNQLRRFSEIQALVNEQVARREASPLPKLSELTGEFSGEIKVSGSLRRGITTAFQIQGKDWQWGRYSANRVQIEGGFEDNTLTLLPVRFESGDRAIAFSGQIGGGTQSGQLRIANLPLDDLQAFFDLPININGDLNATATLGGSFLNPEVVGELQLKDGTLNGRSLEQAAGSFDYRNARLNFGSTVLVSGPEPIRIQGSIPINLPFSTAAASDQINLSLNVKNEGLALMNLFSRQLTWENGQGEVQLQLAGTLKQPIATGTAAIQNATLRAQALPDPLTNVTGQINFAGDRLTVQTLTGQLSRGQVTAQGTLPLFNRAPSTETTAELPLTVTLDRLALNLKSIYRGNVNGQVAILGSLLDPNITGEIRLSDGRVLLQDESNTATPTAAPAPEEDTNSLFSPPELRNLRLILGDRVLITREPILNFIATGDLTINGTLRDLRPQGIIQLRAGQVNLYTTRFTLAGGYKQTAQFFPNQGLDPTLDLRLITSVPEITRAPVVSATSSSEVADITPVTASNFGALQTVRIQARIQGPASQLSENLELTSSPSRTPTEIIGLLGGGFVSTLGRGGDSTLALANLAGSALLTQIQDVLGKALGLSEFRLFPTLVNSGESRIPSSLGLAMEVGVDLPGNLSASLLRVLTADQPSRYSLRYRLNDQMLLRGSTDLVGDTRAVLEYEARF